MATAEATQPTAGAAPRFPRLLAAATFLAPLVFLLVLWEVVVRAFGVSPRVFPDLESVVRAGIETVQDGTLVRHIGASLGRVAVGTVLAIVVSIPLGVAMGLSRVVSGFLTPLFRFFSVLCLLYTSDAADE